MGRHRPITLPPSKEDPPHRREFHTKPNAGGGGGPPRDDEDEGKKQREGGPLTRSRGQHPPGTHTIAGKQARLSLPPPPLPDPPYLALLPEKFPPSTKTLVLAT